MKQLLVPALLAAALGSCRTVEEPLGVRGTPKQAYFGYSLKTDRPIAPFQTAKGHSYYYASRDARSPYRDYLRYVSAVREGPQLYAPGGYHYSVTCYGAGPYGHRYHDCRH